MADKTYQILTEMSLNSDEFKQGVKKVTKNIKDLTLGVDGATGNMIEMSKAMNILKKQSIVGKSPQEVQALDQRIGDLAASMGDLRIKQNAMAQSTTEMLVPLVQGFAAVGQAVVASAKSFGISEEAAKKLDSVMINLIGVQQALVVAKDLIEKQTLKYLPLRIKENIQTAIATIRTKALTLSIGTNATAEGVRTTVVATGTKVTKAAAAAQWLWNVAILANPITIIILGVIALTAGIVLLTKAFLDNNKSISNQENAYKNLNKVKQSNLTLDEQILELQKAQDYLTPIEIAKRELKIIEDKIKLIDKLDQEIIELDKLVQDPFTLEFNIFGVATAASVAAQDIYNANKRLLKLKDEEKISNTELYGDYGKLLNSATLKRIEINKLVKVGLKGLSAEQEIKEKIANSEVVPDSLLKKLNKERLAVKAAADEWERLLKLSYGRTDEKAPSSLLTSKKGKITTKPEGEQGLELNKILDGAGIKIEAAYATDAMDDMIFKAQKLEDVFTEVGVAIAYGMDQVATSIVGSLGLASDGMEGFASVLIQFAISNIATYLGSAIAAAIAGASASAAATGPLAVFTTPAFIATSVATVLGAFAAIPKFALGGFVPGSSYSGDNVPIMSNSGELLLNGVQQRNLFDMINGRNSINGTPEVNFRIEGTSLVGVLNNQSRKNNYTR